MIVNTNPPTPHPIQFKDGPAPTPPEPNTVYLPKYHREHRDQALGIYMDAWSRTEGAMLQIFSTMAGDDPSVSRAVFAVLTAHQTRDVMTAVSRTALDETQQKKLETLLERAKKAATKRNRIVHGRWKLEIDMNHETGIVFAAEWARLYEPSDPSMLAEIENPKGDTKIRDGHRFTVSHVHRASQEVETLMVDFLNFHTEIRKTPPEQPPQEGAPPASLEAK